MKCLQNEIKLLGILNLFAKNLNKKSFTEVHCWVYSCHFEIWAVVLQRERSCESGACFYSAAA